jgi:hypothetical protein
MQLQLLVFEGTGIQMVKLLIIQDQRIRRDIDKFHRLAVMPYYVYRTLIVLANAVYREFIIGCP